MQGRKGRRDDIIVLQFQKTKEVNLKKTEKEIRLRVLEEGIRGSPLASVCTPMACTPTHMCTNNTHNSPTHSF